MRFAVPRKFQERPADGLPAVFGAIIDFFVPEKTPLQNAKKTLPPRKIEVNNKVGEGKALLKSVGTTAAIAVDDPTRSVDERLLDLEAFFRGFHPPIGLEKILVSVKNGDPRFPMKPIGKSRFPAARTAKYHNFFWKIHGKINLK
jgi:hypothetical protein